MKNLFAIVLFGALSFISCQEKKLKEEQVQAEVIAPPAAEVKVPSVMYDTTGLYKITNEEARLYIVEISKTIVKLEDVVNNNTPFNMPELMTEITSQQRKQGAIQSPLSEKDRSLFNTHMDSVSNRLDKILDKVSKL